MGIQSMSDTVFQLITCHCIIQYPNDLKSEREVIQIQKCRSHDTAAECLVHMRTFSTKSESEIRNEKKKPEFQRR